MTNIDHELYARKALGELVSHIKNFKGGNKYITYGDLAKRINYPLPHTGNEFGRRIGITLVKMGHMFDDIIIDGEPIPLIQALVVGSSTKLPGKGLKEFNKTYPQLSTQKKKDFTLVEYKKIFEFGDRCEILLNRLNITPLKGSGPVPIPGKR